MKEIKTDPLFEAWRKALHMDSLVRGLLDSAVAEGGTVEARKEENSEAAVWLLGRGCIVMEGYDDNNFYYYIPEEAPAELVNECHAYWADQAARLDAVKGLLRRLRLRAIACGFDVDKVVAPGAESDADSWELYVKELGRRLDRAKAAPVVNPAPIPEAPKKGGAAGVVVTLLLMLVFAIFLTYACFVR